VPTEHVLRTATSAAAETCRLGTVTGRVAAGYEADLLVVAGDLSRDLTALRSPVDVWRGGTRVA
jgi:imidazolonepropionase-like amidohydrolase